GGRFQRVDSCRTCQYGTRHDGGPATGSRSLPRLAVIVKSSKESSAGGRAAGNIRGDSVAISGSKRWGLVLVLTLKRFAPLSEIHNINGQAECRSGKPQSWDGRAGEDAEDNRLLRRYAKRSGNFRSRAFEEICMGFSCV